MKSEFLKKLEELETWFNEEFSKDFNPDTPLWQLEQEDKLLAERFEDFRPLLSNYNESIYLDNNGNGKAVSEREIDMTDYFAFMRAYEGLYNRITEESTRVHNLYTTKLDEWNSKMNEMEALRGTIESNNSLIQRTTQEAERVARIIRGKEAATTRFSEAEIRMDREQYELLQNQIRNLETDNDNARADIERLNREANIIMLGYYNQEDTYSQVTPERVINQVPEPTPVEETQTEEVVEPEPDPTLDEPTLENPVGQTPTPTPTNTRSYVVVRHPTWNIPKFWNPDLTEEQYLDALSRGIYEPSGREYEMYLSDIGLDPSRRAIFWHPSLTEEQILDALSRGIDEPLGPEYDMFLNEHGLSTTYDALPPRRSFTKFKQTEVTPEPKKEDKGPMLDEELDNNKEELKNDVVKKDDDDDEISRDGSIGRYPSEEKDGLAPIIPPVKLDTDNEIHEPKLDEDEEIHEPKLDEDLDGKKGMTPFELGLKLKDLNPNYKCEWNKDFTEMFWGIDPAKLKLPEGFEYKDGMVTNKGLVEGVEPTSLKVTYRRDLEIIVDDMVVSGTVIQPKDSLLKKLGKFFIKAGEWLSLLAIAVHTGRIAEFLKNPRPIIIEHREVEPDIPEPEPEEPEPEEPEPAKPDPVKPEPTKPDPVKPEPTKPEPTKPTGNTLPLEQPSGNNNGHGSFFVNENTGDIVDSSGNQYSLNQNNDYVKTGDVPHTEKDGVSYFDEDKLFQETQDAQEQFLRDSNFVDAWHREQNLRGGK